VPVSNQSAVFLRYPRVAHRYHDGLERKLENIVQRPKRGRRRDVVLARLLWREQRQRDRFAEPSKKAAPMMFPIDAESFAMRPRLPGKGIVEMETPAQITRYRRISEKQVGLGDVDNRRSNAKTTGSIALGWGKFARTDEEIGKAEIVDQ